MGNPLKMDAIGGGIDTYIWIIAAFLFIFFIRNTNYLRDNFKANWYRLLIMIIISCYSILNLHKISEFIYFGF